MFVFLDLTGPWRRKRHVRLSSTKDLLPPALNVDGISHSRIYALYLPQGFDILICTYLEARRKAKKRKLNGLPKHERSVWAGLVSLVKEKVTRNKIKS